MENVHKKELSERDICTKFITPAIKNANWKERQIREEVKLTNGRIIVKGSSTSRGKEWEEGEKLMEAVVKGLLEGAVA